MGASLRLRPGLVVAVALAALACCGCRRGGRAVAPTLSGPPVSMESLEARRPTTREIQLTPDRTIRAPIIRLSRDEAVALALTHNHALVASRLEPAIAAEEVESARAAFDPSVSAEVSQASASQSRYLRNVGARIEQTLTAGTSLSLDGGVQRYKGGAGGEDGDWTLGLTQPLRRGAGRRVNLVGVRLAENAHARSEQELRDYVIALVKAVEDAYVDLILAREVSAIRDFALRLANEQRDLTRSLIDLGRLAPDESASAEAEVAMREADRIDALAAVHKRFLSLMELLSPDAYDPLRTSVDTETPPVDAETRVRLRSSVERALENRPDLIQARLDLARRRLETVRTKDGLLPRMDAFASYGEPGGFRQNADKEYVVGLRLSTSLTRRAERSAHRRAAFEVHRAREALANLERVASADVRRKAVDAEETRRRIPATARVVAAREKEIEVERGRFQVGKSTNLDVLRVQEKLIEARLDATESKMGHLKALTALYAAEGTLLERRGIRIDYGRGK